MRADTDDGDSREQSRVTLDDGVQEMCSSDGKSCDRGWIRERRLSNVFCCARWP